MHTEDQRPLGLTVPVEGVPFERHLAIVEAAASAGYTGLWSSEGNGPDAFSPLVAAAVAAPRLQLGTAIVPVFTRGPAVLAQSATALAQLAPGRVRFGLGASSTHIAERWNAVRFEHPYRRTRDTLRFLAEAFAGELVDREFETFSVRSFRLAAVPAPPPKVLVAALQPQMLRLAGREAQGAIVTWVTADDVVRMAPLVRDGGADREVVARVWVAPTTDVDAARAVGRRVAVVFLTGPALRGLHRSLGREPMLAQSWRRADEGDLRGAAAALPTDLLDELVLHGSPARIGAQVEQYRTNGVSLPVLALLPVRGVDPFEALRALGPAAEPGT